MTKKGHRQDDREHEELCACDEGEEQTGERSDVARRSRPGNRAVAEEDRPDERRIRRVLRQQRRSQHEPGSERRQRCRDVARRTRRRHGPGKEVGRPRGTRKQKRIHRVRGRCRVGRRHQAVERCDQQRIQLTQRRVIPPVDARDERARVGDAGRKLRGLKLVRHDHPRGHSDRVIRGIGSCRKNASRNNEERFQLAEAITTSTGRAGLDRKVLPLRTTPIQSCDQMRTTSLRGTRSTSSTQNGSRTCASASGGRRGRRLPSTPSRSSGPR